MSAVIRSQVHRVCIDALEELRRNPDALPAAQVCAIALLAQAFDGHQLAANLVRAAWTRTMERSESRG